MSLLSEILVSVSNTPSTSWVKVASTVSKASILSSMEKTSEVSILLNTRLVESMDSFCKKAHICTGMDDSDISDLATYSGVEFARANGNYSLDSEVESALHKLAAVSVIHTKLDPTSGMYLENAEHGAALLNSLTKTANPFSVGKATAIKNAGGFGGSGSSGGGFLSGLGDKIKGAFSGPSLGSSISKGLTTIKGGGTPKAK